MITTTENEHQTSILHKLRGYTACTQLFGVIVVVNMPVDAFLLPVAANKPLSLSTGTCEGKGGEVEFLYDTVGPCPTV